MEELFTAIAPQIVTWDAQSHSSNPPGDLDALQSNAAEPGADTVARRIGAPGRRPGVAILWWRWLRRDCRAAPLSIT